MPSPAADKMVRCAHRVRGGRFRGQNKERIQVTEPGLRQIIPGQ